MDHEVSFKQRIMGCFGTSVIMHGVAITFLLISSFSLPIKQLPEGNSSEATVEIDLGPSKLGSAVVEPMVRQNQIEPQVPVEQPEPQVQPVVEPQPVVVAPKPKPTPQPKVAAKKPILPTKLPPAKTAPVIEKAQVAQEEPSPVKAAVEKARSEEEYQSAVEKAQTEEPIVADQKFEEEALATVEKPVEEEQPEVAPVLAKATASEKTIGNSASSQPAATPGMPTGIRDASQVREQAGNRPPDYPVNDRLARRQGTVTFVARIGDDGRIQEMMLENSSSSPTLDESAIKAFKKYMYAPGQQGWIRKRFTFSLGGGLEEVPTYLRR